MLGETLHAGHETDLWTASQGNVGIFKTRLKNYFSGALLFWQRDGLNGYFDQHINMIKCFRVLLLKQSRLKNSQILNLVEEYHLTI